MRKADAFPKMARATDGGKAEDPTRTEPLQDPGQEGKDGKMLVAVVARRTVDTVSLTKW